MVRYTMLYPGDPPLEVLQLTRQEFLDAYPRAPIKIGTYDDDGNLRTLEQIKMQPDEIVCDFCDADPGPEVWVYHSMRGYCRSCAEQQWFRYLTPAPEKSK